MSNLIRFTLGSIYGSGHGKKEVYIVKSNLDGNHLSALHQVIKTELGFEIDELVGEYEECSLKPSIVETLHSLSLLPEELKEELFENSEDLKIKDFSFTKEKVAELYSEMDYLYFETIDNIFVLNLWLSILKFLDPSFEYEILGDDVIYNLNSNINPPGYGLFH